MRPKFLIAVLGVFLLTICLAPMSLAATDVTYTNLNDKYFAAIGSGTTEFNVTNDTDVTWTDFHLDITYRCIQCIVNSYTGPGTETWTPGTDLLLDVVGLNILDGGVFSFSLNTFIAQSGVVGDFYITGHPTTDGGGNGVVPEPSTMMLLGSGLVGLVGYGRRRFKK